MSENVKIFINNQELSVGEVMTLTVALDLFILDLNQNELFSADKGLREGYLKNLKSISKKIEMTDV